MSGCLLCTMPLRHLSWGGLVGRQGDCLCSECRSSFERIDSEPSRDYFRQSIYDGALDSIYCMYSYNGAMKEFFHRYKFLEDVALAQVFSFDFRMLRLAVPIPLSKQQSGRTFSPVEAMLSKRQILPLLEKTTSVKQSTRGLTARLQSDNPFTMRPILNIPEEVWLVDDIYTTGTTLHQAAYILKNGGVKRVHGFCLVETLLKK